MELKITETPTNSIPDKMLRDEYTSRINRVIDYIEKNIDDQLSLDTLANVANFSRFHFHRIFRSMVGETLNCFIQRIRIEKAAAKLSAQRKKSITDIAFECGFSGSAAFSRAFKDFFGMTPAQWRSKKSGGFPDSKICITESNMGQSPGKIRKDFDFLLHYNYDEKRNLIWRIIMKNKNVNKQVEGKIEVKEMPAFHVAYVRHIGPYKGNPELFGSLFGKLMKWAGPRDLLRNPEMKFMSVYYDDPSITDEEKLRVDACMTVPEKIAVEGEIGKMSIPGGKFAVGRFEINTDEYEAAWNSLMGGWLPESGYQCDDRLCYELYQNDPEQHPEHKHVVDICVPVKPL